MLVLQLIFLVVEAVLVVELSLKWVLKVVEKAKTEIEKK
jgi:hypothetical protein